jgi:hypothetical protein
MAEHKHKTVVAWALLILLLGIYHSDGYFRVRTDAIPNIYLPVSILNEGNLSFSQKEFPFMFWKNEEVLKHNGELERLQRTQAVFPGKAVFPYYYLTKSRYPGIYVNSYGIGAGLTALPVFAVIKAFYPDYAANPSLLWRAGKLVAALCVAGSAVLVFLTACYFLDLWFAVLIALAYGLGTCVWSDASQTLLQQSPNVLFLAMGVWALVKSQHTKWFSTGWSGAALGMAVLCRPTSAFAVIAVAGYLAMTRRKELLKFILGGLPLAAIWAGYNLYYFGTPIFLGQAATSGKLLALAQTGSSNLWQTPFWEGAMGVLFSPARGVFIYSPFLLFAFPFAYLLFKDGRYRMLAPFFVAALAMIIMIFKWYSWWGGWTFGYRLVIDAMPFLVLMFIPGMEYISGKKWLSAVFAATLVWSIGIQALGAFSYDTTGWNDRPFYYISMNNKHTRIPVDTADKTHLIDRLQQKYGGKITVRKVSGNIDLKQNRYRLMSIADNPISYYLTHFQESRLHKRQYVKNWLVYRIENQ